MGFCLLLTTACCQASLSIVDRLNKLPALLLILLHDGTRIKSYARGFTELAKSSPVCAVSQSKRGDFPRFRMAWVFPPMILSAH
eukprot:scaffold22701_cov123-Cylindrotheca_fusiformis.AAC.2